MYYDNHDDIVDSYKKGELNSIGVVFWGNEVEKSQKEQREIQRIVEQLEYCSKYPIGKIITLEIPPILFKKQEIQQKIQDLNLESGYNWESNKYSFRRIG